MNANELADWLDKKAKVSLTEYFGEHLELAATMLRQQDKEIEALKEFAIWMSGCGYDFTQHNYFIKCRDSLLKKVNEK